MSTLSTAARNAACNATTALVDAGAGAGKIRMKSAGGTVIAEVTFGDPAFGAASTGVATANGLPLTGAGNASAGTGTAVSTYDITDSANTVCWSGPASELGLSNSNVANGQAITVNTCTHTQPA
jgi:hypothetical protein